MTHKVVSSILEENATFSNVTRLFAEIKSTAKISCRKFDFSRYPFDHNTCPFRMESENINLTVFDATNRPIKWFRRVEGEAEGFYLTKTLVVEPITHHPLYGKTIVFGLDIDLKRQLEPYVYQYYLPCIVIVISSFFSFVISFTSIPARVSLIVTLFLTLTNMFIHQKVCIIFDKKIVYDEAY